MQSLCMISGMSCLLTISLPKVIAKAANIDNNAVFLDVSFSSGLLLYRLNLSNLTSRDILENWSHLRPQQRGKSTDRSKIFSFYNRPAYMDAVSSHFT